MTAPSTIRPVLNIRRMVPGARPEKFARVVFPEGYTLAQIEDTMRRFPDADGFRCDLRQIGPQGFSLPLSRADFAEAGRT